MSTEHVVSKSTPLPLGYVYVPKGEPYVTRHCRLLTHAANRKLFVVQDQHGTAGIRVPTSIAGRVRQMALATRDARAQAVLRKDELQKDKFRAQLRSLFPKMPSEDVETVLKHTLTKNSHRVGRTSTIPIERAVHLAVIAHVRHSHTSYDSLLRAGISRADAREKVALDLRDVCKRWGYKDERRTPQNVLRMPARKNRSPWKTQHSSRMTSTTHANSQGRKQHGTKPRSSALCRSRRKGLKPITQSKKIKPNTTRMIHKIRQR